MSHWITYNEGNPFEIYGVCSECGFEQSISNKLNYCPNCGVKMYNEQFIKDDCYEVVAWKEREMNIKKRLRTNKEKYPLRATMSMLYRCEKCEKEIRMYLQEGLEDHSENHKPVPYGIACKCGGHAFHILWELDEHYNPPIFITEKMSYFKNDPSKDCGIPIVR